MKIGDFAKKLDFRSLAVEIISIVIGVLLALAANGWNNHRLEQAKLATTLENVSQELAVNEKLLQVIHQSNKMVVSAMEEQPSDDLSVEFVPGLQIRDTAWQTFLTSGVAESADVSLLQSLHDHYALQEVYRNLSYQTVQTILSTKALVMGLSPETDESAFDNLFRDNIKMVVFLEEALLTSILGTIEVLSGDQS